MLEAFISLYKLAVEGKIVREEKFEIQNQLTGFQKIIE
jgi:hypothetical protein